MYYTIYKITNSINGKFYIGKHQTKVLDDGYMGSGKLIKRAIKKHGAENFTKEILHVFGTEFEMNEAEKLLVVIGEESYNLCPGGEGGFGYINQHGLNWSVEKNSRINGFKHMTAKQRKENAKLGNVKTQDLIKSWSEEERKEKLSSRGFLNKRHTDDVKNRIGQKTKITSSGVNNSQYGRPRPNDVKEKIGIAMKSRGCSPPSQKGKYWWNNGLVNCRAESPPDSSWVRGRI